MEKSICQPGAVSSRQENGGFAADFNESVASGMCKIVKELLYIDNII